MRVYLNTVQFIGNAPHKERYMWLMEGYQTIGRYLIDYREFVQSFLEPVETHLEAEIACLQKVDNDC